MEKISTLFLLLFIVALQGAVAQSPVEALAGEYDCKTVGVPASLEITVSNDEIYMYFCRDVIAEDCQNYRVHPVTVNGELKGHSDDPDQTIVDWKDVVVRVKDNEGTPELYVTTDAGIDIEFVRQ